MTGGFEPLEHTADAGVVAWDDTLAGAFANAALGLFSITVDLSTVGEAESKMIEVHARSIEELLFSWLNELIYVFDVEHILFKRCEVKYLTDDNIKAVCYGERYDPRKHELKLGVKSATFHMLEVDKSRNRVQVIFDV